jgi:hypothetical protein
MSSNLRRARFHASCPETGATVVWNPQPPCLRLFETDDPACKLESVKNRQRGKMGKRCGNEPAGRYPAVKMWSSRTRHRDLLGPHAGHNSPKRKQRNLGVVVSRQLASRRCGDVWR